MSIPPITSSEALTAANTLQGAAARASSPNSSSPSPSPASIGTTFLSMLVQELQNQDPTAPMDSTQMVGQMISLNQLDQLTSINQVLTSSLGGAASSTGTAASAAMQHTLPGVDGAGDKPNPVA